MERRSVWRKVLLGLVIVVAVGGVGAAVATVTAYHEATKIDRSEPLTVLDEYLHAVLVGKDSVGAELYRCASPERLAPLSRLRAELDDRERNYGVEILVSWGSMARSGGSPGATVSADLIITAMKDGVEQSSSHQPWVFQLVDEDGWRVCAADRAVLPSAVPSAASSATQAIVP